MSTVYVECWKCDDCGFRWIKTEIWPERCASSKCRKRSWNKNGGVAQLVEQGVAPEDAGSIPVPATTIEALRAICKGEPLGSGGTPNPALLSPILSSPAKTECGYKWWEDGVYLECLMSAGHKSPKHGQAGMFRKLDD